MKEREFVWLHFVLKVLTRQGKDNIYIYIYSSKTLIYVWDGMMLIKIKWVFFNKGQCLDTIPRDHPWSQLICYRMIC